MLRHVADHVDAATGAHGLATLFRAGHAGVDLFFVISGFIILFVHGEDIGRPDRLGRYLGRRASRVWPPYWVALALTVLMAVAGGHAPPAAATLLRNAALLPATGDPLLGIAWTLEFEAVFYVVFAVLVLDRRAGTASFVIWLVWIVLAAIGDVGTGAPQPLWGFYGIEFFMGLGAAALLRAGVATRPRALALLGLVPFLFAAAAETAGWLDGGGRVARFAYGLPAAMLVLGLAAAERRGRLRVPHPLRVLGGASYSLYLFQFVLIGVAWQLWRAAGLHAGWSGIVLFVYLVAAALGGGVLASRLVERPLLRALRPRRAGAARPAPAAAHP